MILQLTVRGGIYGVLKLQEIDTDADDSDFPGELVETIRSKILEFYRVDHDGDSAAPAAQFQTEQQVYEICVRDREADLTRQYQIPESVVKQDARIGALIDGIWARAKPIPENG